MSSLVDDLDPQDPDVQEKLRDLANSNRSTAPLYAELYLSWYGKEPTVTEGGES